MGLWMWLARYWVQCLILWKQGIVDATVWVSKQQAVWPVTFMCGKKSNRTDDKNTMIRHKGSFLKTRKRSKLLVLDHYFKLICETTLLWKCFALVQYYYNSSETLRYFKYGVIPNHSYKVIQLHRQWSRKFT